MTYFCILKTMKKLLMQVLQLHIKKNKEDSKTYLKIQSNITIKSIIQNNTPLKYSIDNDILTIFCSSLPDQDISSNPITINYSVAPTANGTQGFYSRDDSYFTEFEPNSAEMLLPCFDDPIVKSTFSVKLQIPSKLTGLSNMMVETSKIIDNEKELTFAQTPPMCVYLLAIFVGDFASIEGETKNGLPVKMYGENGRQELLKDFLKGAIFAVNWMEEKIGVKY